MAKARNMFCPGQRTNTEEYKNNWDRIFGKKDEKKTEKPEKSNGKTNHGKS